MLGVFERKSKKIFDVMAFGSMKFGEYSNIVGSKITFICQREQIGRGIK